MQQQQQQQQVILPPGSPCEALPTSALQLEPISSLAQLLLSCNQLLQRTGATLSTWRLSAAAAAAHLHPEELLKDVLCAEGEAAGLHAAHGSDRVTLFASTWPTAPRPCPKHTTHAQTPRPFHAHFCTAVESTEAADAALTLLPARHATAPCLRPHLKAPSKGPSGSTRRLP